MMNARSTSRHFHTLVVLTATLVTDCVRNVDTSIDGAVRDTSPIVGDGHSQDALSVHNDANGVHDVAAPDGVSSHSDGADVARDATPSGVVTTVYTDGDFTINAPFMPAPEIPVAPDLPIGMVHHFVLSSTMSSIYPTDIVTHAAFNRDVWVYVPRQYIAGTMAPFILVQDGVGYLNPLLPILDNMIHDHTLPVMIAIFIDPGPDDGTPGGERSFEYDSVSDTYFRFIENELLPKILMDYGIALTSDPDGRAAMGGSSGGAAAFTMGWFHPELYHRILTYSGSFCDLQPSAEYPHGAWEYHEHLLAETDPKPLRVALEVGSSDLDWNSSSDMLRDWQTANRNMAAALAARAYHYRFVFANGASHVDRGVVEQTLPETLRWLWQGYPIAE